MKKIIYTTAALLLLGVTIFSSCDKIKDLAKVNFVLQNSDGQFTIPAIVAVGDVTLGTDNVYINLDSIIKAQNGEVSAKNVKEVYIKSCQLSFTNGDSKNNFSALESCKLDISSNAKPDFLTVASVSSNPDVEAQVLNLPVDSTLNLKEYFLSANQFSYRVSGKNRKTTDKELNCTVLIKYNIVAGL